MEKLFDVALLTAFAAIAVIPVTVLFNVAIKKVIVTLAVIAVVGLGIVITTTSMTPTVTTTEEKVVYVDNMGYCRQEDDGELTLITQQSRIVENPERKDVVLVVDSYYRQFLCFAYTRTETHLEIPKLDNME